MFEAQKFLKKTFSVDLSHLSIPWIAAHDRCNITFLLYRF